MSIPFDHLEEEIRQLSLEATDEESKLRVMELWENYKGDEEIIDNETYLKAIEKSRGDTSIRKLYSGLPTLDGITEGFWEGNLIVVSGPTKEGKTTFCQTLTINMTASGHNTLWFPFDTPGDELISRFAAPAPFFFLPRKNPVKKKTEWIESKIIEGIVKYDIKIAFIDHLAMLTMPEMNRSNYTTQLDSLTMELKQIAMRWRIPIVINHHIRKIEYDSYPNLSDLKDSSAIAQNSDFVIMVWRKKAKIDGVPMPEGNISMLAVQANRRNGRNGLIELEHRGDRFVEKTAAAIPKEISQDDL